MSARQLFVSRLVWINRNKRHVRMRANKRQASCLQDAVPPVILSGRRLNRLSYEDA